MNYPGKPIGLPPPKSSFVTKGPIVFTAAADGSIRVSAASRCCAWHDKNTMFDILHCLQCPRAFDSMLALNDDCVIPGVRVCVSQIWKSTSGEAWEQQLQPYHTNSILAIQFVYAGPSPKPFTGSPAPINTGVVNPSPTEATVVSANGDSAMAAAGLSQSMELALSPLTLRSIVSRSKAIGAGKEPPATVFGTTPMYNKARLITIAADGKMAVFDVYTGVWVYGCVGVWVWVCGCGCVGVWVCGCVGVWVCGCVGVWVCGCFDISQDLVAVNGVVILQAGSFTRTAVLVRSAICVLPKSRGTAPVLAWRRP